MASLRAGTSDSGGEDASWGDLFSRRYLKGIDSIISISNCALYFILN